LFVFCNEILTQAHLAKTGHSKAQDADERIQRVPHACDTVREKALQGIEINKNALSCSVCENFDGMTQKCLIHSQENNFICA